MFLLKKRYSKIMTTLTVTVDTAAFGKAEFDEILQGGVLLHTAGLLNLKWEEFSALDTARELGLSPVEWEAVQDDTPSSLTFVILYRLLLPDDLQERLLAPYIVDCDCSPAD